MVYIRPEIEIVEFDENILTDGILVSQDPSDEGNGDSLPAI
jgi:hypothetical protein